MKKLLFTLLVASAVTGCAKDEKFDKGLDSNIVQFSAGALESRINTSTCTWDKDTDMIGISTEWMPSGDYLNVKYKATETGASTGFTPVSEAILYPNGQSGDPTYYAYYPHSDNSDAIDLGYSFMCSVDITYQKSDGLASVDLLSDRQLNLFMPDDDTHRPINFTFKHLLSQVILNIGINETLSSLKGLEVKMCDINVKANYNFNKSQISSLYDTFSDVPLIVTPQNVDDNGDYTQATVIALFHPSKYTTPTLEFKVGGKTHSVTFDTELTGGKSHTYSVILGNALPTFTSGAIGGWINPENSDLNINTEDDTINQPIDFKDQNFLDALLDVGYNEGASLGSSKVDIDGDSKITYAEAAAFTGTIDVSGEHITSMDEIKYFPNLFSLNCSDNDLTTLDVSACTKLTYLKCSHRDDGSLTTLNASGCTKLTYLDCNYNDLTTLDISGCTELIYLDCSSNDLNALDISACTKLRKLDCTSSGNIDNLDLSHCPELIELSCSSSSFTTIDLSPCPRLENLSCCWSSLTTLDISPCPKLKLLYCQYNKLTTLDLDNCPELMELFCFDNQLTTLDISKTKLLENSLVDYLRIANQTDSSGNPITMPLYVTSSQHTILSSDSSYIGSVNLINVDND